MRHRQETDDLFALRPKVNWVPEGLSAIPLHFPMPTLRPRKCKGRWVPYLLNSKSTAPLSHVGQAVIDSAGAKDHANCGRSGHSDTPLTCGNVP